MTLTCAESDSVIALVLLCGIMEMITKGADGSRSAIFMVPVKVRSALADW